MKAPPWIKLWWDWYTTRSHIGVSGEALALGPVLMLLCRAAQRHSDANSDIDRPDEAWAVTERNEPVTVKQIAAIARFPTRTTSRALCELVEAGTVSVSTDGAYGFPNFWKWQETSQASRMRKHRAQQCAHSTPNSDDNSDDKRLEERGFKDLKEKKKKRKDNSNQKELEAMIGRVLETYYVLYEKRERAVIAKGGSAWKKVSDRAKEGFSEKTLDEALHGGRHNPAYWDGENTSGKKYRKAETILRDSGTTNDHSEWWRENKHRFGEGGQQQIPYQKPNPTKGFVEKAEREQREKEARANGDTEPS